MIKINGVTISGTHNCVTVINGKIIVDGKDLTPNENEITIEVIGNIDKLEVDTARAILARGDVTSCKTLSADVEVSGNILGSVSTMSGNVSCRNIEGNVSTMSGNISR